MGSPDRGEPPPTRSREDRILAGVCGGLAQRSEIDPVVYRVTFGVLGVLGVGIVLYAAAWALLPEQGSTSAAERLLRRRLDGPVLLALVVALLVAGGLLGPSAIGSPTIALVVVLAIAALAAHRRGVDLGGLARSVPARLRSPPEPPHADSPASRPASAASPDPGVSGPPAGNAAQHAASDVTVADRSATEGVATGDAGGGTSDHDSPPPYPPPPAYAPPPAYEPPPGPPGYRPPGYPTTPGYATAGHGTHGYAHGYAPHPRPPRRRPGSWLLPLLAVAGAVATAVVLATLQLVGILPYGPQLTLIGAILVVGGGLLVGTRYGRGRPLIPVGLVLSVLLVAAGAITPEVREFRTVPGEVGDVTWRPETAVSQPYRHGAGDATLDLTNLRPGGTYEVRASQGAGEMRVRAPTRADVVIHATVGVGTVAVNGEEVAGGLDVATTQRLPAPPGSSGLRGDRTSIEVHAHLRTGEVRITSVAP